MTFTEIVTYPYTFFISLLSSMEDFALFYIVLAGLVICAVVMLITWVWRYK